MTSPPHLVLLVLDSVRAANTTFHGYDRPTTPFLAQLAARHRVFHNAYAPGNWSVPSHTSMFTGLYPSEHGLSFDPRHADRQLAPEVAQLPTLLAAAGYTTHALTQNVLVSRETGLLDAFGRQVDYWDGSWRPRYRRTLPNRAWNFWVDRVRRQPFPYQAGWTMRSDDTLADIRRTLADATQPAFVFANLMDAHMPYTAPLSIVRRFVAGDPWQHSNRYRDIRPLEHNRLLLTVDPEDQRQKMALYDAAICHLDTCLRRFVGDLQRSGLLDRAILIITADHGEMFGEHDNIVGHGPRLYQELIHVPLILIHPDLTVPTVVTRPVSLVDIFPTLLAAAGADGTPQAAAQFSGLSLLATAADRPAVISEYAGQSDAEAAQRVADSPALHERSHFGSQTAVVSATTKLIAWQGRPSRLFDLARDPRETTDVNAEPAYQGVRQGLEAFYSQWQANRRHYPPAPRSAALSAAEDEIVQRRLRELGYVD